MTNATEVIEAFKNLPAEEKEQVTDFVISQQNGEIFELTEAEIAELDRRSNLTQKTYTLEEVFAKYRA